VFDWCEISDFAGVGVGVQAKSARRPVMFGLHVHSQRASGPPSSGTMFMIGHSHDDSDQPVKGYFGRILMEGARSHDGFEVKCSDVVGEDITAIGCDVMQRHVRLGRAQRRQGRASSANRPKATFGQRLLGRAAASTRTPTGPRSTTTTGRWKSATSTARHARCLPSTPGSTPARTSGRRRAPIPRRRRSRPTSSRRRPAGCRRRPGRRLMDLAAKISIAKLILDYRPPRLHQRHGLGRRRGPRAPAPRRARQHPGPRRPATPWPSSACSRS
jgi:hypothetical protein